MSKNTTTPYKIINWIADAPLKPGPKSVLLALSRYVQLNKNGNRVWPGQDAIRTKTLLSLRSVNENIKLLGELGYIDVSQRDCGDGYRKPNEYFLNFGFFHAEPLKIVSKTAYGHTQKTTKSVSKTAYEGDTGKELDVEMKVEGIDPCNQSSTGCDLHTRGTDKQAGKKEDKNSVFPESSQESFERPVYEWSSNDAQAAAAFVWHDLFADQVNGPIVRVITFYGLSGVTYKHEELDEDTKRLIAASKLASNYSVACTNGNPKARVRFWHECGRLFYPTLPRFAKNHKISPGQNKPLHDLFDTLGSSACYVIAFIMANWPKDWPKKAPDLSELEGTGGDQFHSAWLKELSSVQLPDTHRAYELAGKRYAPHRQAEFEERYLSIVREQVEQNVEAIPDELAFVSGPSKQQSATA